MRGNIVETLTNDFNEEKDIISTLIENKKEITPYSKEKVKGREIINKDLIPNNEKIVLDYYKLLLNTYYKVTYPNRSYIMTELMNIIPYLHLYNRYTVYKFDFKNFFYNINPKKCFNLIQRSLNLKPYEYYFLRKYLHNIDKLTPGIGLHNAFVEIVGKQFDLGIRNKFSENMLHFARFVDDCILILDEKISRTYLETEIGKIIKDIFGEKLGINNKKTEFRDSESVKYSFDYLGYEFEKGQAANQPFKVGIAKKKLDKYNDKIEKIILSYDQHHDVRLLSFQLELIFKRIVYYGSKKNQSKNRWQVRGISDSYKELKKFINHNEDFEKITNDTKNFFCKSIFICFKRNGVRIPAKIVNQINNKKFISLFLNNKAILLHKKVGLSHSELKKRVMVFTNENLENYSYNELANKLLRNVV
ncbi:hypothetical protein [Halobacillus sp. B29]|uniref:hypothetical protein n=1 Tax=Halobacillus sp. B29 TaxID=3457432 RepID=UPI003FCEDA88